MPQLIECVPNFSVGNDSATLDAIESAIESVPGAKVLARESDDSHGRSVVTFAALPEAIVEAAVRAAKVARDAIDLTKHRGVHPRIGAMDVCPLIPLEGASEALCVEKAHEIGGRLASELGIPAYFYGAAALRSDRTNLAEVRNIGFEALREAVRHDDGRIPDCGERELHPTAGAVAVGVRKLLVAYNVDLTTDDLDVARRIAHAVRGRDGGFTDVKALGFSIPHRGCAQVSMNLTDFTRTGIHRAYEFVKREAARYGVGVRMSELIGLVPRQAILDAVAWELQMDNLTADRILEDRIAQAFGDRLQEEHRSAAPESQKASSQTPNSPEQEGCDALTAILESGIAGASLLHQVALRIQCAEEAAADCGGSEDSEKPAAALLAEVLDALRALARDNGVHRSDARNEKSSQSNTLEKVVLLASEALRVGEALSQKASETDTENVGMGALELSTALSGAALILRRSSMDGLSRNQLPRPMEHSVSKAILSGRNSAGRIESSLQKFMR